MENAESKILNAYDIQQFQQNRYPLLFVDEITDYVPGKYAKGNKSFTYNEWFFPAHFEDEPNVPGFVQVEVLAQVFIMSFLTIPECKGKKTAFLHTETNFYKKLVPGHRLEVVAELSKYKRGVAEGTSVGYLNGEVACESKLKVAVPDVLNKYLPKFGEQK